MFKTRSVGCFVVTGRNEVSAKVIFLHLFVILFTGGEYLTRYNPPGTRYTPQTRYTPPGPGTPPLDQVHPPGTRYIPPGPGTPPRDQVHPPGPGTPPGTRYNPPGPGTTPQDQVHPRDQVYPPPPPGIRSTIGRYASYWNAFL